MAQDHWFREDIANIFASHYDPEDDAAVTKKSIAVARTFGLKPEDWIPKPYDLASRGEWIEGTHIEVEYDAVGRGPRL